MTKPSAEPPNAVSTKLIEHRAERGLTWDGCAVDVGVRVGLARQPAFLFKASQHGQHGISCDLPRADSAFQTSATVASPCRQMTSMISSCPGEREGNALASVGDIWMWTLLYEIPTTVGNIADSRRYCQEAVRFFQRRSVASGFGERSG